MTLARKLKALLSMDRAAIRLLAEAYWYLAWGRVLMHLPFARIAPTLGRHMEETPSAPLGDRARERTVRDVAFAIRLASRYTLWKSQCLVRALAGLKMLERRGIASTLYLGTGRDEAGKLAAHAWLRCGSYYLTGAEEMARFRVVGTFANPGRSIKPRRRSMQRET